MRRPNLSLVVIVALFAGVWATAGAAEMTVTLLPPWDGKRVPDGQQCRLFGGKGATPPMQVTGMPEGTVWIVAEFNDRDDRALSKRGGLGRIGWPNTGASTYLRPVPGMTGVLKYGAIVVGAARAGPPYASPGYLPPCSGGQKHRYVVDIVAMDGYGRELARVRNVRLGRY
ncbi:MAG: hypothetical protein ACWA5A_08300 [Marinibacterium sp.]